MTTTHPMLCPNPHPPPTPHPHNQHNRLHNTAHHLLPPTSTHTQKTSNTTRISAHLTSNTTNHHQKPTTDVLPVDTTWPTPTPPVPVHSVRGSYMKEAHRAVLDSNCMTNQHMMWKSCVVCHASQNPLSWLVMRRLCVFTVTARWDNAPESVCVSAVWSVLCHARVVGERSNHVCLNDYVMKPGVWPALGARMVERYEFVLVTLFLWVLSVNISQEFAKAWLGVYPTLSNPLLFVFDWVVWWVLRSTLHRPHKRRSVDLVCVLDCAC